MSAHIGRCLTHLLSVELELEFYIFSKNWEHFFCGVCVENYYYVTETMRRVKLTGDRERWIVESPDVQDVELCTSYHFTGHYAFIILLHLTLRIQTDLFNTVHRSFSKIILASFHIIIMPKTAKVTCRSCFSKNRSHCVECTRAESGASILQLSFIYQGARCVSIALIVSLHVLGCQERKGLLGVKIRL
ncbi:hypothetical protein O6H91_12G030500 [Diphasiastrum complanatum]|uniref:Uncharacterized protein n=1 Tax=Diphasiastrum complanatum TaxID=34168 RepID=A0ACC2C014_DIPCM|nr:hypothetical protein O6H91_Y225600 [Diphasiastrum complanatum]KAJ7535379.1 hypothetical protein O6H91_12G030500 [Diphasiastrum complanatum]